MHRVFCIPMALAWACLAGGCGPPPEGTVEPAQSNGPSPRVRQLRDRVNQLKAEAEVREMTLESVRRRANLLAQQMHELRKENRRQLEHIKALGGAIAERDRLRKRVAELQQTLRDLRQKLDASRNPDPNAP
jgi:chromosome segregation ATPase